ncbi:MAG: hypothetical protein AABW81_01120 [Nanoarchaeota archaeon]
MINNKDISKYRSLLAVISNTKNPETIKLEARIRGFNLNDIIIFREEYGIGEFKEISEKIVGYLNAYKMDSNSVNLLRDHEKAVINKKYLYEALEFKKIYGYLGLNEKREEVKVAPKQVYSLKPSYAYSEQAKSKPKTGLFGKILDKVASAVISISDSVRYKPAYVYNLVNPLRRRY